MRLEITGLRGPVASLGGEFASQCAFEELVDIEIARPVVPVAVTGGYVTLVGDAIAAVCDVVSSIGGYVTRVGELIAFVPHSASLCRRGRHA